MPLTAVPDQPRSGDHTPFRRTWILVLVMALTLLVALLTAGASGWTFVAATSLLLAVLLLAHPRRPPGGE